MNVSNMTNVRLELKFWQSAFQIYRLLTTVLNCPSKIHDVFKWEMKQSFFYDVCCLASIKIRIWELMKYNCLNWHLDNIGICIYVCSSSSFLTSSGSLASISGPWTLSIPWDWLLWWKEADVQNILVEAEGIVSIILWLEFFFWSL